MFGQIGAILGERKSASMAARELRGMFQKRAKCRRNGGWAFCEERSFTVSRILVFRYPRKIFEANSFCTGCVDFFLEMAENFFKLCKDRGLLWISRG
jgi:hypothetical protein